MMNSNTANTNQAGMVGGSFYGGYVPTTTTGDKMLDKWRQEHWPIYDELCPDCERERNTKVCPCCGKRFHPQGYRIWWQWCPEYQPTWWRNGEVIC